ncbi:MAG: ABC transporter substrate-binding protein, partial [Vicinamibacterales bacterium]
RLCLAIMAALVALFSTACQRTPPAGLPSSQALAGGSWNTVLQHARGTTVIWRMWRGDPAINTYIDAWVTPRMRAQFGVDVRAVDGQGPEMVNTLVTEREALRGRAGTTSLIWINGETFAQLQRERLLSGPWTTSLPNASLVDTTSPIIGRDFEQDPTGYESPWGMVQFALIYDRQRTPNPPSSIPALASWIREHPGRFTHDQSFTGVTFLKGLMYGLNGGVERFEHGFDETRYSQGREALFTWLTPLMPYFWREGRTYPPDVAAMHRLFANGEIDFTMSNNQNEVVAKVRQGILPSTSRALLLDEGTIANAHYLGIPFNAPNPAGAMVLANFLLSPEAQLEKQRGDVWGDGTVLKVSALPDPWPARFASVVADAASLPYDVQAAHARPEVDPRYHARLLDDWRQLTRVGAR